MAGSRSLTLAQRLGFESDTTRVLSKSKLNATIDQDGLVIHQFQDIRDIREEHWKQQRLLGSGGFGVVFLQKLYQREE